MAAKFVEDLLLVDENRSRAKLRLVRYGTLAFAVGECMALISGYAKERAVTPQSLDVWVTARDTGVYKMEGWPKGKGVRRDRSKEDRTFLIRGICVRVEKGWVPQHLHRFEGDANMLLAVLQAFEHQDKAERLVIPHKSKSFRRIVVHA